MSLLGDCEKMSTYHLFEQWKCSRWRRGDRFYRCELVQDLFGNWLVVRQWGGVSSGKGGAKETVCKDYGEALELFEVVAKRREKRDYMVVESALERYK
jgi:hypothetical protein